MLNGKEKAAAILSILGEELSQKVLSFLPENAAVSIISASENLKTPTRDVLDDLISEYNAYMLEPREVKPVTEPEKEQTAVAKKTGTPVDIISSVSPEQLANILKTERSEIAAYVLSHLPVEKIYETLTLLGEGRQTVESKLVSIKDVPMAKEMGDKVLKAISERLI